VVADKKGKSGVLIKTGLFEATSHEEVIEILQGTGMANSTSN
jgi:hybrid polyketide synthase/nonribosomal peptide synthetase ACE1